MKQPTKKQLTRMEWGRKRVNVDGTTRGGFRWPVGQGGWVEQDGPVDGKACGRGLHVGLTWAGLSSGGNLSEAIGLVVGWLPEDVLGSDVEKVRVRRLWVAPGTWSFPGVLRAGWGTRANLSDADLSGANLSGAYLSDAYLSGANLSGAYLSDASLYGADLSRANLSRADLSRADLSGADLSVAYLSRAVLYGAELSRAVLYGAELSRAVLSGAYLTGAVADRYTTWPEGFDPATRGVTVR